MVYNSLTDSKTVCYFENRTEISHACLPGADKLQAGIFDLKVY